MKKKLEADLMSIAHRVLQMKNKSDINQLCVETQKLYEKLAVLRFVEEHFGGAKPTIGQAEVVAKMKQFFEENHLSEFKPATSKIEIVAEEEINEEDDTIAEEEILEASDAEFNEIEPAEEEEVQEEIIENLEEEVVNDDIVLDAIEAETETDFNETEPDEEGEEVLEEEPTNPVELGFTPAFELDTEEEAEIATPKKVEAIQISFEELLGANYSETLFVKAEPKKELTSPMDFEIPKEIVSKVDISIPEKNETKTETINDKLATGISIGLNDKIAFVKNLFGNSDEDYSRVINQLITFNNFEEAQSFIEEMVKPDYSNWEGKEDYEKRFMDIIEKKFV